MQNSEPSTSKQSLESYKEPIRITCRSCSVTFPFKSIIQHAKKSTCKDSYSQDHFESLRRHSEYIRSANLKIAKSKSYEQNKVKIAEKRKNEYDKVARAKKYQ